MAFLLPVYEEIVKALNADPSIAYNMNLDQLKTIVDMSKETCSLHDTISKIYKERTPLRVKAKINKTDPPQDNVGLTDVVPQAKIKAKTTPRAEGAPPVKIKAKVPRLTDAPPKVTEAPPKVTDSPPKVTDAPPKVTDAPDLAPDIDALNNNHLLALDMTQQQLEAILKWSDNAYYVDDADDILADKVYDYIKRIYGQRKTGSNDKALTMLSISSDTGVGSKPKRERDTKLPFALRSLDNIFRGEGDVGAWTSGHRGPYMVSAKMDGISALYYRGRLYTRGDALVGRDISHVIPFLKIPAITDDIAVRGEIVMSKSLFNDKYKGKGKTGSLRKINRSSVSGAVGSINNIDEPFLSDLTFAAYEIIDATENQKSPSSQFEFLERSGFITAYHEPILEADDDILNKIYHRLIDEYDFEIDGLVISVDRPYSRTSDKNPDYAKAYKEALEYNIAVTTVRKIEWNVSQYGYLAPTIVYDPVIVNNFQLTRATGHNAKNIVDLGLGPGAKIEVIHHGSVNPQVYKVLEPVAPSMPTVPYVWVATSGEPCHIKLDESSPDDVKSSDSVAEMTRTIQIKKIHKFLSEIEAKGIGETTVGKIYDHLTESGHMSATHADVISKFIHLTVADVTFLGATTSKNIVSSIGTAMQKLTVPKLMSSSKVFGRGLGARKFSKVLKKYPDFISERLPKDEYIKIFKTVEGFGLKTAELAADGMDEFWDYVYDAIPSDIFIEILDNTRKADTDVDVSSANPEIKGKNIYITGFRDDRISDFITSNGGALQSGCTTSTHILVRKSSDYSNKKTEFAEAHNITIMDRDEFIAKFLDA